MGALLCGGPLVSLQGDEARAALKSARELLLADQLIPYLGPDLLTVEGAPPVPILPEEVAKYQRHHKKVLTIKPGITGLAQVSGRSDLSFEEEVKLDVYYIENWSLAKDISILLKTPMAVFRHRQVE